MVVGVMLQFTAWPGSSVKCLDAKGGCCQKVVTVNGVLCKILVLLLFLVMGSAMRAGEV